MKKVEKTVETNEETNELGLHGIKKSFKKEIATSNTKFYKGSIRSGQKIEFEGSLVILGDVNAGAKGNKEAIIAAASICSAQIRIADIVKEIERNTDDEEQEEPKTYAYVDENGEIVLTQ